MLYIIICTLLPTSMSAQSITQDEALKKIKQKFSGQDVDYYSVSTQNINSWTIFVDAEPQKGWEHKCYLVNVPRDASISLSSKFKNMMIEELNLPPALDMIPLEVKNRYGSNATEKPYVRKAQLSNKALEVADRTYAVILSGGANKNSNYERYWNDCSYVYQVLTRKYGIPKSNIYVIMSDGTNPAADMRTISGSYKSSPLDLDGDGNADIEYSATQNNIHTVLNELATIMNQDDHLLFYVIDHGGTNDGISKSYINLWGDERLQDYTLTQWLEPILNKKAVVNCVLGQCYSGGFVDDLTKKGCVVSTASTGNESSWACFDRPYDEFVYQWTSAINEQDTYNNILITDSDKNGRVTMEEAFAFAKANDRVTEEHPQFQSTPLSVGEDLAFNHLAPSADIYVKDNEEDTGKEPNTTTRILWNSPSICVRNNSDSIFVHETPEYSTDHQMAYIHVRVYNRGREKFTGKKYLHVYWSLASTYIPDNAWKGRENLEGFQTGGELESAKIPEIEAGSFKDIFVRWALPSLLTVDLYGLKNFSLLAKIMDTTYDDGYVDGRTYFNLRDNNDHAQKNVIIINRNLITTSAAVFVRGANPEDAASYSLEILPRKENDKELYSKANVEFEMSPKIYDAWGRGGYQSEDIVMPSDKSNGAQLRTVKYISPQSKLKKIYLKKDEFDIVKLKFDFVKPALKDTNYVFDLIQRDENGKIVGGETFIIQPPLLSSENVNINAETINNGTYQLGVDDTVRYNSVKWLNDNNEIIGNKDTITVTPTSNDNSYTVYVMDKNGYVKTGSISLSVEQYIKSVSLQPNDIFVSLKNPAPVNADISVTSLADGTAIKSSIPEGKKETSIDSSTLSSGVYVVNYLINKKVVDQKKINIK